MGFGAMDGERPEARALAAGEAGWRFMTISYLIAFDRIAPE
jgi:hypothetical protein